jgi:TPP-dependent pyruvate/acetoin dehydrogenase alpha subunit
MTAQDLIAFEREVADLFEAKMIAAPIHLSGGNEEELIAIFKEIRREDFVFSTWRSHYHALLHGIPRERVMADILAGKSMMLHYPEHHFFTSAIVGGILPIACGVAAAGARCHVFVGDMCASIGAFHDAVNYSNRNRLPVMFHVENNGLSTNTPTEEAWGPHREGWGRTKEYFYERTYPHTGSGVYVAF